jgi:hypothetical protein
MISVFVKSYAAKIKAEGKREDNTKQFYTGSSHKLRVVQSSCTFKGVHYNYEDYNCSSIKQDTSLSAETLSKRLPIVLCLIVKLFQGLDK